MNSKSILKVIKVLYIAGFFDDHNRRSSKIGEQIFKAVNLPDAEYYNGGSFQELSQILEQIKKYQLIFWFADVPNDKPKLVKEIKRRHKACVLITSKRNLEGKYTFLDLIFHAIGIKSNLFVEFSKKGEKYQGRVIDPLGNVFFNYNDDFGLVGKVLRKRADELLDYTRVFSERLGDELEIPDEKEFFELIKKYADVFHKLIHPHPEAANRFFGNASFRCERGFPSFKVDDLIFVSRRNVDKRAIDKNAFVAVKQELPVRYFGDNKPSVDTPIQIKLYDYFSSVRYMLHSHAYVEKAPFTSRIVPCGAIEEANEIIDIFPDKNKVNFSVNLKGHGSLILVDRVEHLRGVPYIAREMPEIHLDYAKNL